MSVETVAHEFELSIGRYERYCSVVFKPGQPDALMELNVFHVNRLALTS